MDSTPKFIRAADAAFVSSVLLEVARAREIFPDNFNLLAAATEEVGETLEALFARVRKRVNAQQVWDEAVQAAAMAVRIAVEGDAMTPYRCPLSAPTELCTEVVLRRLDREVAELVLNRISAVPAYARGAPAAFMAERLGVLAKKLLHLRERKASERCVFNAAVNLATVIVVFATDGDDFFQYRKPESLAGSKT